VRVTTDTVNETANTLLRPAVLAACGYETASLTVGYLAQLTHLPALIELHRHMPSISELCWRHRKVAPVIVGALAAHLYWPVKRAVEVVLDTVESGQIDLPS
jgi:hypothetical protein